MRVLNNIFLYARDFRIQNTSSYYSLVCMLPSSSYGLYGS